MAGILDEVDDATRAILVRYRFDPDRFAALQEAVRTGRISAFGNVVKARIEPPPDEQITRLPEPGPTEFDEARAMGVAAIRRGEVATAVLNGGMATRFGGVVKGIVEAVDGRSFLEWKLADASRAARAAGDAIPVVVMNSFATDEPTRSFLAGLGERAADLPELLFFEQFVSMRLQPDGSLWRDAGGRPSLYGPGHGDFAEALRVSGTIERLRRRGVRYLMLSNVDNLGARVDPAVLGMHLQGGRAMTIEVAAKEPGDVGGAPALVDGRLVHVEGFRFPPDFDQNRIRVFNCNSFVFDVEALDQDLPLPWHYVEKSVDGRPAVQLERLVNELTSFLDATFLEVPRTGPRGRLFPIKSPDDLERSRAALREMLGTDLIT